MKGNFNTNFVNTSIAIIMVLLMASAIIIAIPISPVQAQDDNTPHGGAPQLASWATSPPAGVTPNATVDSHAYMSITPNPIGLRQTILVNLWLEPPTHYARYRSGFTVTFTKPDGTTIVVGPLNSYQGDTTDWFNLVVDQVGNWTAKFEAAGNYFPAGYYYNGKVYNSIADIIASGANPNFAAFSAPVYLASAFYGPSSTAEQTFNVQQDQVVSWPSTPLPTDYWTRPIPIDNRDWWVIGGQYPFAGQGGGAGWPAGTNAFASNYKYTPYVQAPSTAHIVWNRQGALAGISGGQYGYVSVGSGEGSYAGTPSIIFQGRAYQSINKPMPITINGTSVIETTSVWQCYDIRTGQVYWEQTGITQAPTVVTYNMAVPSVPGAEQTGLGSGTWSLMYIGPRLIKYDPWSGAVTLNISLPVSSGTYYDDPFVLSVQTINATAGQYRLINWTTTGSDTNFTTRIQSNVTYPFGSLGTADYESMIAVSTGSITPAGAGHALGQFVMAASLISGQLLWNVTTSDIFFSTSTGVADHGKFTVRILGGWWDCWDLHSGALVWKSDTADYPWGDFGAYNIASYGGMFYDLSYHGIYAWNWTNGKVAWHFIQPNYVPFEAAYDTQPFFTNPVIADGKLYVSNGEHSPTEPLERGWHLFCLNATTGDEIWSYTSGGTTGAIADGYLTFDSRYDGNLYVFGRGLTATTVTTPSTAIPQSTAVLIKGTVMDMSPAQPNTPCVSASSMETQMEYLHMQQPITGLWNNETITGVPVTLQAISSDNSVIDIGTTTTNGYYGTFSMAWTPPSAGTYQIVASFAGNDAYGSSGASTGLLVGPAPTAAPTVAPTTAPSNLATTTDLMTYIVAVGIAIIIAIAIVGILILRKH